jgi:hypothetical protein
MIPTAVSGTLLVTLPPLVAVVGLILATEVVVTVMETELGVGGGLSFFLQEKRRRQAAPIIRE